MAVVVCACTLVAFWSADILGEQKPPPTTAAGLEEALAALRKHPDDPSIQEHYIDAFPQTYKDFLELFDFRKPLYDGHEYVEALWSLVKHHEKRVGTLLVQLSEDAHYNVDAPSYLQNATADYASQYTNQFAGSLKSLPSNKRQNLITFLADVENHHSYPQYQVIINHLKGLGETAMAKQFEIARAKRIKQPHG